MPVELKYYTDDIGVEYICQGVLTGADVLEANKEVYNKKNFINLRYQILDGTSCKKFQASATEMQLLAEQDKAAAKINPNFIVALISATDYQFGMSRMYQALLGDNGLRAEIFRDRKSAEKWIQQYLKYLRK